MNEAKVTTTVRLGTATVDTLKKFCRTHRISQTDLMEKALQSFFDANSVERYQVSITKDHIVLLKIDDTTAAIVEVTPRNGLTTLQIHEEYRAKLRSPVELVVEKEERERRE